MFVVWRSKVVVCMNKLYDKRDEDQLRMEKKFEKMIQIKTP